MCTQTSQFPEKSVVRLARAGRSVQDRDIVEITPTAGEFTLVITNAQGHQVEKWTGLKLSSNGCTLTGGTLEGSSGDETLGVEGTCALRNGSRFLYLIAVTEDQGPPDNHVVEWVSEDNG